MKRAAVVLLLVAAVLLGLLAGNAFGWRDSVARGDRAVDALRLQTALRDFAAVRAAGRGYDNGLSESKSRGLVEAELAALGHSRDHAVASIADNLLGILAYADATGSGPVAPAPVDQAVADFQAAVRADTTSADAKFNLELLLHRLIAHGVRKGANNSTGAATRGHRGAGGGIPGRGY
jgi:hypothetical protein